MNYLNLTIAAFLIFMLGFQIPAIDKEKIKKEVYQAERDFEKIAKEKGISEAFYQFAADDAVIKRQNDTLIIGKENIKLFYQAEFYKTASVTWSPDFIDVSDCGNMAYTYGNYIWKAPNEKGEMQEFTGVFHTVWKRQADKSWKYVWD